MNAPLDRGAVVWGLVFVALGLGALLDEVGLLTLDLGVALPAVLVVAGVALTLSALADRSGADRGR